MAKSQALILVILLLVKLSVQDTQDNEVDDKNAFAEVAANFLKDQNNMQNIGSMMSNLMQSEGGKQIGDMLMGMAGNNGEATSQVLQGLGSILTQNADGKGGLDPAMLGNVLSMFNTAGGGKSANGPDVSGLLSLAGQFFSRQGNTDGLMDYLPTIMETVGTFMGLDGETPVGSHSDHNWFLPPVLEKMHILFEQFFHSEAGKNLLNNAGAEKLIKLFSDENGKFSYDKFVELLENQSFRRHWIRLITNKIAVVISYVADPKIQKKYLTSTQYFVNSLLKSRGYPKSALFDPARPTETITAFINHLFKQFFNYKINAKQYVQPAVEYVQELFRLAQNKGMLGASMDSRELSHKLTDTINLEIIEPIARVNRAYRFATKTPKCDKYVMCLVNQEEPRQHLSLPGLKNLLSKGSSVFASWFLSGHTGTSFWEFYHVIAEENNCKAHYQAACNDFHVQEIKVTTEYVHNEL